MTLEGTLVTIDGRPALRFERRYRQPVDRVWRAISDPEEMATWFPSNVEGERKVGAELRFVDDAQRAAARAAGEPTRADGPMFRGTVITFEPPATFEFSWGSEVLRFELRPDADGTLLVFTQLLSHPSVAARNGAGWQACLAQLDRLLGGGDGEGPDEHEDPMSVYDEYLERMGPPLGVPSDGSMTWERSTHVDADRVREVTSDPREMAAWGAGSRASEPVRWEIEPTDGGTLYRVTYDAVDRNAELAATWHALLIQLDMYLAAGELIPDDHHRWIPAYEAMFDRRTV
jgi:uncharacterized protein YndB with AHSA1/START domain